MTKKITLKIDGMHCVSCAMNIDGEIEDLDGVKESNTNYAKAETVVSYDHDKVSLKDLSAAVKKAGYICAPASENRSAGFKTS
ncbi:MAG: cation transporter [Candidatus Levyibacteriota bacterium]